jgi:gamma-glutamyl-gamma-aminobutyrate hydrolase PuuD
LIYLEKGGYLMGNAFTGIAKQNAAAKRPLIGICANYSTDDKPGIITGLGLPGQEWQLLADDYVKSIERAGGIPIIIPITEDFSFHGNTRSFRRIVIYGRFRY